MYSYCDELKEKFDIKELSDEILKHRIDGFVYACNMVLDDGECIKKDDNLLINKSLNRDGYNYNIDFSKCYDFQSNPYFVVQGTYNNLSLLFVNYYKNSRNILEAFEMPFSIYLKHEYDGYLFIINVSVTTDGNVCFEIKKTKEEERSITFYIKNDFSKVLKMIKSFTINPTKLFNRVCEIMQKKRIMFNDNEVGSLMINDKNLDLDESDFVKKIKMIINNH